MTRLNRLIGLPVICGEKKLGRVSAVTMARDGGSLAGLAVRGGLGGAKWVPAETILCLGELCVLVRMEVGKRRCPKPFYPGRVSDTGGMRLGRITDARVDERTLAVDALEITFGPLDDLFVGRRWVRDFTIHPLTGDVVVPCEWAEASAKEDGC
ncbi:MAG: PRC-barrel domain-containing protein [Clostridia bacterium]|nr:PRC-barrel domain-containing protein [Clostridia bacterium]